MSFTKIKNLYIAVNHVVAELGKDGEIQRRHELVEDLMMALHAIDQGEFKPDLFDRAQTKLETNATRITELETQLADAQKDVERYQWLRQYEADNETFNNEMDNANCPTEFDCAIDAAIAKEAT